MNVLLINPPVVKPSEPPPGMARLAAALRSRGIACRVLDANLEGLLHLAQQPCPAADTWSRRAARTVRDNLAFLRTPAAGSSFARYCRAVRDCGRVLDMNAAACGARVSFADYRELRRSPLRTADLRDAALHYEDNVFFPYFSHRLGDVLRDPAQLIGFSVSFLSQALTAFAMIGFIRSQCSSVRIALGGGLITSWLRRRVRGNPFPDLVDAMIEGPGEAPLLALCGAEANDATGVCPDYTDLPQLDGYVSPCRILPYSCSSGCYWNRCAFCPEQAEATPYRGVPPEQVTRDLQRLVGTHRPGLIHFLDNALSPAHLRGLIKHPPGVAWYGFARITGELLDPDFCAALRAAGCRMLQLGIESGDDRVLESLRKGITAASASRALAALHRAGIAVYAYLLFGTPDETYPAARRTLDFVARHHRLIGFLNLAVFNMPLHGRAESDRSGTLFYDADLSLYADCPHPDGWDRAAVRRFLDREFTRHPAVAPIVRRDPPVFTSNHAPFFCTTLPAPRT